jgi:hypothetical protein
MKQRFVAGITGFPVRGMGKVMLPDAALACHQGLLTDDTAALAGKASLDLADVDQVIKLIETK